jgi:hypothetical protein
MFNRSEIEKDAAAVVKHVQETHEFDDMVSVVLSEMKRTAHGFEDKVGRGKGKRGTKHTTHSTH